MSPHRINNFVCETSNNRLVFDFGNPEEEVVVPSSDAVGKHQVWPLTQLFFLIVKKIIDLSGGQMAGAPCQGNSFFFCSFQQLLSLGHLNGVLN